MTSARNGPKRAVLFVALGIVMFFEAYLLTAFSPDRWQRAINRKLAYVFERQSYKQSLITHPMLEEEIQQVLDQHPALKIGGYVVLGALLSGNALLAVRLWLALRRQTVQK